SLMGPGVRSTATEPIAARASARAPNGMPTSWATPSETVAAATPAIIRSSDGATTIELLYSRSPQQPQTSCRAGEPATSTCCPTTGGTVLAIYPDPALGATAVTSIRGPSTS